MAKMSTQKMLTELTKVDTPSITNVVATYPKNDPLPRPVQSVDRELVHR